MSRPKDDRTPDDRTLSAQAIQWRVRLQADDVTEGERRAFERWRNQSARHRESYARIDALWNDLDAPSRSVWEELRQEFEPQQESPQQNTIFWKRPVLIAASVLLVLLGGLWTMDRFGYFNPNLIKTAQGERATETLPDGSTVYLNTDTAVLIEYTPKHRRLVLKEGEASFAVTPDPLRPFEVVAAGGMTRAVGTEFNIRRNQDRTTVTVIEGKVNVTHSESQPTPLRSVTAGEQLEYTSGIGLGDVAPANLVQVTGWRHGQLVFDLKPLGDVVAEVDRYWPGKILVLNAELRNYPISGSFQTDNPEAVVRAIAKTFNVNSMKIAGYLFILY